MARAAVIVDAVRTPSGKGKPGGGLAGVHPAELLGAVLRELCQRNGLDPVLIDDVIAGCVGQNADQAINIARTASLCAGFPESVPGTTIDRQCGSSQQAAHFAAQAVMSGVQDVVIACGVESMSRVPMSSGSHGGDPFSPLEIRYPQGLVNQGISAELLVGRRGLSRARLDEFAVRSHERATAARASGMVDREIVPVSLPDGQVHAADETIRTGVTIEKLAGLPPAFHDPVIADRFPEILWEITAGNSSPLTDGASAILIMSEERAFALGLQPRARFHSMAVVGSDPIVMLDGVIPASKRILERSGLSLDEIDVYEVNEAFAPVPLAWVDEFGADESRLNPRGGALALGHPLGASGMRILTTMLNHLESTDGRYGLMTMCERGGMANATIIEKL